MIDADINEVWDAIDEYVNTAIAAHDISVKLGTFKAYLQARKELANLIGERTDK